ncbi:MAG: biotin--[acetyl-CoA-carboxylase] ligase [Lachnospiraceae bacterium]|nr:biotin--[acetyl-CoA-carboxylase] ligase [Lachnospiraceae bacterium]
MKSEILAALRESESYVSGQELCEKLNVSRTAVWKKIKELQGEGYEIEAVPNRGYRIVGWPDTIAAEEVESRLTTVWAGRPVKYFEEITSTNQYAKRIGEEGAPEGTLVVADEQTQGKGRSGRSWTMPRGTAIAMTLLIRPKLPPSRISMVTLVMGLAVARACRKLYGLPAGIKWPNDVVIHGKKLCGILTELSAEMTYVNYVVIGIGINVNVKQFPEEIQEKATSLFLELGRETGRAELIASCMEYFEGYYEKFIQTGDLSLLMDEYNELLLNRDQKVRVLEPGQEYTGTAQGINQVGELLVVKEDGTRTVVYAGEVSVRGIYGYV